MASLRHPAPSGLEDGHLTLGKALTVPRFSGHAAGAETPRAESLVVHYDTTVDSVVSGTTVVDTSGNGNNQFVQNGLAYNSTVQALDFAATNARAYDGSGPNSAGAWTHSISFWFYAGQSQGAPFFIGEKNTSKCVSVLFRSNNVIRYYFWGNDIDSPSDAFSLFTWTHLVVTYDGGTTKSMYINGEKITTTDVQTQAALNLDSADEFLLGCQVSGTEEFKGLMSNFKIWNVTLTAEEVAAEYALGRTGKALNITDTAVCLGGTVPRAQLDVRGAAKFNSIYSGNTSLRFYKISGTFPNPVAQFNVSMPSGFTAGDTILHLSGCTASTNGDIIAWHNTDANWTADLYYDYNNNRISVYNPGSINASKTFEILMITT